MSTRTTRSYFNFCAQRRPKKVYILNPFTVKRSNTEPVVACMPGVGSVMLRRALVRMAISARQVSQAADTQRGKLTTYGQLRSQGVVSRS